MAKTLFELKTTLCLLQQAASGRSEVPSDSRACDERSLLVAVYRGWLVEWVGAARRRGGKRRIDNDRFARATPRKGGDSLRDLVRKSTNVAANSLMASPVHAGITAANSSRFGSCALQTLFECVAEFKNGSALRLLVPLWSHCFGVYRVRGPITA